MMASAVEGDGLNENLFQLLWTKPNEVDAGPSVRVPDTIIFKYQQPTYWYFTALDGVIRKKAKDKLTNAWIEAEFLKRKSPSGIVAAYTFISPEEASARTVEFFGEEELKHFLHYRKKPFDGMLQKFIDPKGPNNDMFRVIWTPNKCLVEKKVNLKPLFDPRYDIYERAVTYEGEEFHCQTMRIKGSRVISRLEEVARSIQEHVFTVSAGREKPSRMVLHFKQDAKDQLWLLNATSIRMLAERNTEPLDINSATHLPPTVNNKKFSLNPTAPVSLQKTVLCRSCEKPLESDRMFEVTYKFLVTRKNEDGGVPPLILKLHPRLDIADYENIKNDPLFLDKQTLICDECYLDLAKANPCSGEVQVNEKENPREVRLLDPQKLSRRRQMTAMSRPVASRPSTTSHSVRPFTTGQTLRPVINVRPSSTAGGEIFLGGMMPVIPKSEFPKIPALNLPRNRSLERQVQQQKSLASLLGTTDISSFLQDYYTRNRQGSVR